MKTLKNIKGLTELDTCEQVKINGGESLWYHLGYALGKGYNFIAEALDNPPNTPCANTYK